MLFKNTFLLVYPYRRLTVSVDIMCVLKQNVEFLEEKRVFKERVLKWNLMFEGPYKAYLNMAVVFGGIVLVLKIVTN